MLTKRQRLTKAVKRLRLALSGARGRARAVFVLGEMRSGTNMLATALERHDRVECYHENDDEAFDDYVLRPLPVVKDLVTRSRADDVVFKSIADMGRARELFDTFPDARGFFIFRRFEDVVNSALRSFSQHNEYLRLILEDEDQAHWRRWGLTEDLVALIREWHTRGISEASARALIWYVRNRSFLEQGLIGSERLTLLNYEALVQDPHAHFRLAARFLGLPPSEKMGRGVVATSIRRREPPELEPAIQELCEQLFAQLSARAKMPSRL